MPYYFDPDPLHIYTDGSSLNNGRWYAKGGYAALFVRGREILKHKAGYFISGVQTNNRYELEAIRFSLKQLIRGFVDVDPDTPIVIHPDSKYAIDALTNWIHKWQRNGFRTSYGKPVQNRELIEECVEMLDELEQRGYEIAFQHVAAHKNNQYNNMVDESARNAAAANPIHRDCYN